MSGAYSFTVGETRNRSVGKTRTGVSRQNPESPPLFLSRQNPDYIYISDLSRRPRPQSARAGSPMAAWRELPRRLGSEAAEMLDARGAIRASSGALVGKRLADRAHERIFCESKRDTSAGNRSRGRLRSWYVPTR